MNDHFSEHERLSEALNDPQCLKDYKIPCDGYRIGFLPRVLGGLLVGSGNLIYGTQPSYLKFRAIEIIARVPYFSWVTAMYTLMTMFFTDEEKAMKFSRVSAFARMAQDNETMHVVVISKLALRENRRAGVIRHTIIPMLFAFGYYWASYVLYFVKRRWALELNYMFENHAFHQYNEFLMLYGEELKDKPVNSEFLIWYGRHSRNQYEFFRGVRNDELIHRNQSLHEIAAQKSF